MRKNVKNDSVIRAITLGIAGMMTLTATVGAFPMQAMAAEPEGTGNGSDSTTETTETTTETKETTETTVTPDDANRTEAALPITDGDNHQINVEKETVEQYVVNDEAATTDQSVTEGKVEDYITVETTVEAETHHVVVAETPNADGTETTTEIVSGVTADGEVVEKIEVDGEDVAPEQVNIVTKMTGEDEEATIKEIVEVEDEDLVYGYFDENGLFQDETELFKNEPEKANSATKAYAVFEDGSYQEATNVISYKTEEGDDKEEKTVYITGEYEPDNLTVEVVHTVTDVNGEEHIVAVPDGKDADDEEAFMVKASEGENVKCAMVLDRQADYQIKKDGNWVSVSKEEYDSWKGQENKKVDYTYESVEVKVGNQDVTLQYQPGQEYCKVVINGKDYYVKADKPESEKPGSGKPESEKPEAGKTQKLETYDKKTFYVNGANPDEKIEVSSDQVTTVTKYNLEYNGETIETGLTLEQKNAVIDSIEGHKYVAVNQDKYAIEIPDPKEDNPENTKRIYLNTDQVSVLKTHDVTFTETRTHYYVDNLKEVSVVKSSEAIIDGKKGIEINGVEYLVEVSFTESTNAKPVINNTLFSYIKDKSGNIIGVKVVVDYAVNGVPKTFWKDIVLSDFSASNIAKLTVNPDPVVIKSGVSGYTFVTEKTTMDIEVPTTETVEGSDGTTKVVISSDKHGKAQYMREPQITFGGLQGVVSQKDLIVKTYVRYDRKEQKEDGNTHYATNQYTPALSTYFLKYSSTGYRVFGTLDENGNLIEVKSDKPNPDGGDFKTQEDAISLYLSKEDAKALADLAKNYGDNDTLKKATEDHVNALVDKQIADLKKAIIDAHPEWDPNEIVWSLSKKDIEWIKKKAIESAYVHWYVLKYEKDNYHIDGVLMIDEITIELNGKVEVIPPTVVPTPDPEPNPGPTPPAPAPGPGPTEPTPGPAPTEPEPTPAPTPVVLGVNRAVETAQAVAPAEEGAVLGARRADGGSVLGASRTKAVLGARRGAQTGDVSGIAGSVSALFASAFAGIGYVVSRRKKKEEDK